MKKKMLSVFLASIAALVILGGCSGGSSGSAGADGTASTGGGSGKGKAQISVFTWGYPAEKTAREAQADLFNKTHDDIEVKITVSPDYDRKLDAMIAANQAPDVFETSSDWYHVRSDLGQLVDLNEYAERDGFDINQYYPTMINDFKTFDDKLESLPIGMATFALAINKDLFAESGATIPDADQGWTWDEALAAARKITKGEGANKIYGMSDLWMYQQIAAYLYGGRYTSPDFTQSAVNSPEAIKGFQFMTDLIYKYQVMPDATAAAGLASAQRFYAGKSGIMPMNNWDIPDFVSNIGDKFDWDIVPMPTMADTGKSPSWYITEGYGISSSSKNKDAAWEFVKWVTSDPEALKLASNAAIPPTEASAADFINSNQVGGKTLNLKPYLHSLDNAVPSPFGGVFAEIGTDLTNVWQNIDAKKALQQDVTPEIQIFAKKLQDKLDEIHAGN
ncbi:ABC transporter substrate-binding protein [Cohnella cellulosilytica]|uniref:ABC transporter substrate-binding protein n=1 Tax=Cohnella cellulosilytica TaxID=986710 RepID=A0ABW2F719_9BACL